jgi:hypothetical protein
MHTAETVVAGTLNADGTLVLDRAPALSPGRVTVILRQEVEGTAAPREGWWGAMQSARNRLEAAGCRFLDENEMRAHIDWLREEDRVDELLRELDAQRQRPEQP